MIYYANGFAWRMVGEGYGVLQCAPIEDAPDDEAWCDVDGFNAEPAKQAEVEAVRDALAAAWLQDDAAYLYQMAGDRRDSGVIGSLWSAEKIQESAAHSAQRARELMGVA